jgi:hypothetical protein
MNNIEDLENEVWENISEWEGYYQVSNMGRIKSLNRVSGGFPQKGRILNQYLNKQGTLYVCFSRNRRPKKYYVFQLVSRAFIRNVKGFRCFKHKNGDLTDNRLENIEYDNRDEKIDQGIKTCDSCKKELNLDNFSKTEKTGKFKKDCKECNAKAGRGYYHKNIESRLKYAKEHYNANKDKMLARHKIYMQKNKATVYKKDRERKKLREKTDIRYRLRRQYKGLLYSGFKRQGLLKGGRSCKDFIGCSFEEFRKHIESQFEPWMNWDNYGKNGWHFGHKICCELFDLTDEKQVKICFHYTNLRPEDGLQNITNQDFLLDGRRARDLSKEEKIVYLESIGIESQ